MTENREIKGKVKQFIKEYDLYDISFVKLQSVVEKQGYTVIEYNHIYNDPDVDSLIQALKLSDNIIRSRGFTYADRDYRIVFIHEDLSEQEKLLVLAHEEGHIYCGHMSCGTIIGKDVQDEYEANEFAHYLLNKNHRIKKTNRKSLIIGIVCFLIVIASIIGYIAFTSNRTNFGEYYLTETGDKYHEKECIFVKNKTNVHQMTQEEFDSGEYEPCEICLPD